MKTTMLALLILAVAATSSTPAQQSAHYMIKAPVINSGGQPVDGSTPTSPGFILRPDAIGESAVASSLSSASYRLSAGFVESFPTPGELDNLVFNDAVTLAWDPEPLAGHYHLYRTGPMGAGTGQPPVGDCLEPNVAGVTTTDNGVPPADRAFFYFVNAASCVSVEGPGGAMAVRCP